MREQLLISGLFRLLDGVYRLAAEIMMVEIVTCCCESQCDKTRF